MPAGNVLIGQSGGPTSVINASLAGLVTACGTELSGRGIYGMRWGIEGLMRGELIDLAAQTPATIEGLCRTPGSALGSCRHKLSDEDFPLILEKLKAFDIRWLFMIGGNDTMDTVHRVSEYANEHGHELLGVGVPKTVDNDLFGTDHTPGYPSAARFTALSVMQAGVLARDMQKVDQFVIYQSIGRDAGWLTAASALGKRDESDPPHLLYLPERVFDRERFLADAERIQKQFGFVSIACGEGLKYADGTPVSASRTADKFANVEFGAMGGSSVGLQLHRMLCEAFCWRGEFQITESLPMSARDRAVELDVREAFDCGREAVRLASEGVGGVMVGLQRESHRPYRCGFTATPLAETAVRARPMPEEMIDESGTMPAQPFFEYAGPLVGPLPEYTRLAEMPAPGVA
jgi:6-phosphofructokinase 1